MSMQTDSYTFAKSLDPQSVDETTPFKSKTFSYVNDINSGVYNNTGPTLVQFDLSSSVKDYVNRVGRTARIAT